MMSSREIIDSKNNRSDLTHSDDDDDDDDEDYLPTNDNNNDASEESDSGEEEEDLKPSDNKSDKKEEKNDNNDKKIDENRLDEVWKEFCEDVNKKTETTKSDRETEQNEKITVTKTFDFAGETVVVKETVDKKQISSEENKGPTNKDSLSLSQQNNKNRSTGIKRASGGISSLLDKLKKPKMSTLTKSLHDWNEYKESNAIEEELDQHRRSKGSYLEKQAFLFRTDLREFEKEKSVRDHERRIRDLKQQNGDN